MSRQKVVIIGAGIGGLATANLLAKAGFDVHLYEKESNPGGRAGLLKVDGFTFDTGPSWYLMPEVFSHYYDLLDEPIGSWLDLIQLDPAYKVFFEHGQPLTITSSIEKDAATFEAIETGAGDALRRYVDKGDEIYRLSLKHFLYSNFTNIGDFLQRDVLSRGVTMLRLATRSIDRYVSTFVTDLRLKQILEYPTVFLGTSPFTAPAIYSLMSALDFREGVFYPRGGLYTIITSLVAIGEKLGVQYYYDSPVRHIATLEGHVRGIQLEDDTLVEADIVISNADLHFTETQLLDAPDQSYPESYWSHKEAGPSALLMYIGVKGSIPEFEHHNLLFVDAWKENFDAMHTAKTPPAMASIYISKPTQSDKSVAPESHENIFVLVPLPSDIELDANEINQLTEQYLGQIKTMTGVDLAGRAITKELFGPNDFKTKYHAWRSSMLGQSHLLKQSAFLRTPNKSKKVKNLYYVGGNTTPGIGLPMCLIGAELVYKRLAGDKKSGAIDVVKELEGIAR